ncbi:hypothetical protein [Oculatella sp. FACHB-28]|nr:hypothetical protein [Oculatella sp. FACHB-28]
MKFNVLGMLGSTLLHPTYQFCTVGANCRSPLRFLTLTVRP